MDTGTLLGIVGIVISVLFGVIGLVTGYYFYRKSKQKKEPCWAIRSNNLIRGSSAIISGLAVLYKGEQVENLTISKLLIWNKGEITLDRQDIETIDHLRVVGKGDTKLLDIDILASNNNASRFSYNLAQDKSSATLNFDYLDRGNGAVLQIVHTGASSNDLTLAGAIKGASLSYLANVTPVDPRIIISYKIAFFIAGSMPLSRALRSELSGLYDDVQWRGAVAVPYGLEIFFDVSPLSPAPSEHSTSPATPLLPDPNAPPASPIPSEHNAPSDTPVPPDRNA